MFLTTYDLGINFPESLTYRHFGDVLYEEIDGPFRVEFHQSHNLVLDGIKEVVAMYEGKNILVAKPKTKNN